MASKKHLNDIKRVDCFNNEIKIGDQVIYMESGNWKRLLRGKIIGFTTKMIKITSFDEHNKDYFDIIDRRYPDLVAKITEIK